MISLTPLKTLQNLQFRRLLIGRFSLILGFRMLGTLLGWWIYQITKNPFAIGVIGLSAVIPAISSALYAGHMVDMNEKRKMLLSINGLYIFLIGGLCLLAFNADSWEFLEKTYAITFFGKEVFSSPIIAFLIYGIIFFTGFCRAFLGPILPAMIPKIVSKEVLPNAITLNQATFLTASVGGHAVGGLLISFIGVKYTLLVIILLMFIALSFFSTLDKQPSEHNKNEVKLMESLKEGILYIYNTKEILGALCLDMFAVLFGGAVAMIPAFATDILKVGAKGFGLLNAASDIGSMLIIITLSFIPLQRHQGKILLATIFGFGFCIVGFGLSEIYWISFFMLMLSGMFDGISVVIRGTIIQLKTPDKIRGRVLSVNSIFIMSSNEMGQFESGAASKILGVARSVVFGGSMTLLIALIVAIFNPKLRSMEYRNE